MKLFNASFDDVEFTPVPDGKYYPTVIQLISSSIHQCLCTVFIVDHDLDNDAEVRVDWVLLELASARWRGVNARLLIGGSRNNPEIRGAALLAKARADELGIDTRVAAFSKDDSCHVKLVVSDNYILTGSHNWSRGMFGAETQDSVLLQSPALAAAMTVYFEEKWTKAAGHEYDVSL